MNSKAIKRQLRAAIALVRVAAIALGSSTYAWFANNTKVTANDLQLTAMSNDTFLLISATKNTATEIQAEGKTTDTMGMTTTTKVYPSAPALNDIDTGYLTTSGKKVGEDAITVAGVKITDATKAAAVTNWYTAKAQTTSASTIQADSARQLVAFDDYVIHKTLYLTVAVGSDVATNLKVTPTFTQLENGTDISAVKILLVTDDGACVVLDKDSTDVDIKGSNTDLTQNNVRTVDLYLYVDGNDSQIYTNNAANLKGASCTLEFSVETKTA